jgi:O-antigen/teichoic acid export membrane protein
MKNKQIFWNALTTIAQVIGSAVILFVLYRFLVRSIGVERLGIWSLVLATTSMVTLANQGFSTSIVKFVAKYVAQGDGRTVAVLIETAVLAIAVPLTGLCLALYPLARWGLRMVLPAGRVAEAASLLPYAFLSLWFSILGSILLAGLAGQQLITIRNYLVLGGSAIYLLLAFLWVPRFGLLGLAFAQIANTLACFLATWVLLRWTIPELSWIPHRWDRNLFREMWGYGAHFQFVTFSQAVREPVTKTLLAKFGGLAMTGFYDMASRWVFTFRELIVQANLVLVPTISSLKEIDTEAIPRIYRESYRLVFFLSVPTFSALVVFSPLVSRVWLGRYEPVFVRFVALLALGWLVNILSNPAYVVDLGTGALRWVSIGCAVTGILNPALGYLAGKSLGGIAVVAVSVFSLAVGYAIVLVAYHIENRVSFRHLLPSDSANILGASVLAVVVFLPYFCSGHAGTNGFRSVTGFMVMLTLMVMALPMWRHPMRKRLAGWIASHMPARA